MKNVNRDLIFRVVASVLTFICVLLLFSGWIKLADGDLRKDAKKGIKSVNSEIKDVDRDMLKRYEEILEEEDINISPKKFLDNCKKVMDVASDVEIAPHETIKLFSGLKGVFSVLTNEDVIDSGVFRFFDEDTLEEISDYNTTINLLIFLPILFFATLIAAVAVTVLHALNKKFVGISLVVCAVLNFIAYIIVVAGINSWSNDEFYENLVKISAAPVWLLILSAASMVLWMMRDKIGDAVFGPKSATTAQTKPAAKVYSAPIASAPLEAAVFCANCGTKLDADSAFCPECGSPRA